MILDEDIANIAEKACLAPDKKYHKTFILRLPPKKYLSFLISKVCHRIKLAFHCLSHNPKRTRNNTDKLMLA